MTPTIEAHGLEKRFGPTRALDGLDLVAERGMLDLIADFAAQKIAVVMVSHQLAAVANYVHDLILVDRDRNTVQAGPVERVLSNERLSALYNAPVLVAELHSHRTVFIDRPPPRVGASTNGNHNEEP